LSQVKNTELKIGTEHIICLSYEVLQESGI